MKPGYLFLAAVLFLSGASQTAAQPYIFVSSRNTNSVKRFDAATGAYIDDFVSPFSGGLSATQEVVFGPDGHLYVSGRGSQHIKKYDGQSGDFLGDFTSGYLLDNPTKMTFGPDGRLYVSQWGNSKFNVAVFDASSGEFVAEATDEEFKLDQMSHAWDSEGRLYVVSFTSRDVRRYKDGKFMDVHIPAFHFQGPVNVWFGDSGDLFVADWSIGQVRRYNSSGGFKSIFITGLTRVEGYAYGPDGYLYLCDWENDLCNRYNSQTGNFVDTFISGGGLDTPNSITFGPPTSSTSTNDDRAAPARIQLRQNYPNPFNPSTNISFSVPGRAPVKLTVFDILGRTVDVLVDDSIPAGEYTVSFEADGHPTGIYINRLESEGVTVTRSMLLLR